ncbi:MAG TPA: aspartate/glutamate racemase family protein [Methylibium sp.]|uniref:aspartate/glutamate racemase family protein n=1 Tax=Methylibium sp. TaxID=2067992 RepID=UPI002DB633BB|nr:aspartate/glutamate racemase family protein [Methylibium sp.]HEU4458990.1 aspartate/glutamate racemase family protein [Methylibium sp.]
MRTLGLLGGMSWESTLVYYRAINQGIARRAGGLHSAPLLVHSFDFERIAALQRDSAWDAAAGLLGQAALGLRACGAEGLLIATNTMHKLAPQVQAACGLPLLHIADAVGAAVREAGLERVGLLGTRFTMEQPFLREHLRRHHGLETLIPAAADRAEVHRVIFEELCRGVVGAASRRFYLEAIDRLAAAGAQGVVLGCTEIGLLLDPADLPLPAFDSTLLHARQAIDWILPPPATAGLDDAPALMGDAR